MQPNQIQPKLTSKPNKFLISGVVIFLLVLGIGVVLLLNSTKKEPATSTVNPATTKFQSCMKQKNVVSDDWTAYQKAAMDCQNK